MTAATAVETEQPVTTASRVAAVLRMNAVDVRDRVGGPWLILAAIFVVYLAIWGAIRATVDDAGAGTTGALASIFFIVGSTYLIAMTQVMSFALSLGITRWHFYGGIALLMAAETLLHAVALTVLLAIERASGGWWIGMDFFSMTFMPVQNPVLQVLTYWIPLLTVGFVFVAIGAVFMRWGQYGVWAVAVATLVVLGAAAFGLTWWAAWPAVGRFLVGTPLPVLAAVYPLALAALAAVAGYLVVRRALP